MPWGVKPNLITQVYASRIANWQRPDGHWSTGSARPPESYSPFTVTAIALQAIHLYLPPSMGEELRLRRIAPALAFQHGTSEH